MPAWTPGVIDNPDPLGKTAPSFVATLRPEGINIVVSVPGSVSRWFGESGPIPVLGLLGRVGISATLVPVGGGGHKLYLNEQMRSEAGLQSGDRTEITLWRDDSLRETVIPEDLAEELESAGLLEEFLGWPPSHQREYVLAVEDAKRPETRQRRIAMTVERTRSRT